MPIGDIVGPLFAYLLLDRLGRRRLYLIGLVACSLAIAGVCALGWTTLF